MGGPLLPMKWQSWEHDRVARVWLSDCAGLCALQRGTQKNVDSLGHGRKALILGQALMVAIVDLLHDDGELEPGKREKERRLGNIVARLSSVVFHKFLSREAARMSRGARAVNL